MIEDREQLQDPDADWDREDPVEGTPITEDNPDTPTYNELTGEFRYLPDPELDELLAVGEDLPTDEEEFASPPPDEVSETEDDVTPGEL